jgi:RNA polymerase sigma factor (sigma-70 family)
MARTNDPGKPRPAYPRLLAPPASSPPLPPVVPLLRPDQPISPTQEAMLAGLVRRARRDDGEARDLLWRAFGPRLEPALRRCGRMTWQRNWARRDGRPWELDDLRQEAWLVFSDLVDGWNEKESFAGYVTAYFPWRLRDAIRRLEPPLRSVPLVYAARITSSGGGVRDAEYDELLTMLAAALPPGDTDLLRMRIVEGATVADIARRLGVSRRTVARRWAGVQSVARRLLRDAARGSQPWPSRPDPARNPDGS